MKSKFKKVLCMLLVICLMGSVPVEAYSSAYKADFEITGGVYVQKLWDLDKGGKLKIITNCSNPWGNESDNLVVIVQRKVGVVWKKEQVYYHTFSGKSCSTFTAPKDGTYRIYIRECGDGVPITGRLCVRY